MYAYLCSISWGEPSVKPENALYDTVIVRFSGEIGIKGEWTRRTYEKLVLRNVVKALHTEGFADAFVEPKRGRIYVKTEKTEAACERLTRVFGVSSVSPAKETTSSLMDIVQAALRLVEATVEDGASFAVRCHRVGSHEYSSMDVCRELGAQVQRQLEHKRLTVKLKAPDVAVTVEVRDEKAYVFTETFRGVGGFPLGAQAKTVCLLSGGIDSPVACWLAMKRGSPIVPVYFDNTPFTDEKATEKAVETARKLSDWASGSLRRMYIVPHGESLRQVTQKAPARLTCLLCKRIMYRVAECIADMEKAQGIVTGEAIGEQASQTMHNLRVLDEVATRYPVHRPLLAFDKTETEALAKRIGTFDVSTRRAKPCMAAPSKPATRAKLEAVKAAEEKLSVQELVDNALRKAVVLRL